MNPVAYIDTPAREAAAVANETEEEAKRLKRQRLRSVAIALGLGFLVILFYAATIVRMGGHAGSEAGEFAPASPGAPSTAAPPANGGAP